MNDTSNTQSKPKGKYWLLFFVHLVAIVIITILLPEAFWLPLPGLTTALALACDWI